MYGKGGVVKTTTSCNISIALVQWNKKVLQIGCKAFYYLIKQAYKKNYVFFIDLFYN